MSAFHPFRTFAPMLNERPSTGVGSQFGNGCNGWKADLSAVARRAAGGESQTDTKPDIIKCRATTALGPQAMAAAVSGGRKSVRKQGSRAIAA